MHEFERRRRWSARAWVMCGECTWNHLACRRAANASKHFCRGRTSLSSRFMSPPSSDNNTKGV